MKCTKIFLGLLLGIVTGVFAFGLILPSSYQQGVGMEGTIYQLSQWKHDGTNITQNVADTPIKLTGLESNSDCLVTDSNGVVTTSTCGSGGGGGSYFSYDSVNNVLDADSASTTSTTTVKANFFTATSTSASSTMPWLDTTRLSFTTAWGTNLYSNVTGALTGNADTATALAANGANCSAGSLAAGVDASGAAEGCVDVWTEAENTSAAYISDGNTNWDNSYGFITTSDWATTSADYWETQQTPRHAAVTLAGEDYLSLSTQLITANAINPDNLSAADFGDFTCNGTTCSLDATYLTSVAYGDLTGNPSDVITAGNALTWSTDTLNFDGGASPGGELGGTWASPTIDDSLAVSSWNLTTPTFTTNFTFDSVTVTGLSGSDTTVITGTAGTSGNCVEWDANGDIVDAGAACGTGSGGGGSLSTTTEKILAGASSTVSYVTDEFMLGGSASTTAEFLFDYASSSMEIRGAGGSTTILSTGSEEAVRIGEGDLNSDLAWDIGEGIEFWFGTAGDVIVNLIGSVADWVWATGTNIKLGAVQWNSGDNIDGEAIANDTIDDDSIDFTDVTLADITFDVGSVDTTEFGYLNGVTSAIQTQFSGKQDADADLTTYAGITPSANVQSLLGAADYAAMRTLLDLEAGTDFYSISAADTAFEGELDNEAGLYAALSDVTQFWEAGDIINSGTLALASLTLTGTVSHENGGLEADVNAYSGLLAISGGATSEVDAKSELEAQIADVSDFAEADGDTYTGTHDFSGATVKVEDSIGVALASTSQPFVSEGFASGDQIRVFKDESKVRAVNELYCEVTGGTSIVVFVTDGTNDTESVTCTTAGASDTDITTNDSFTAGEDWFIELGTVTGSVDELYVEVVYDKN